MSETMQPAIVIPAFNRAGSLRRLLDSIDQACFRGLETPLVVVSLEGGALDDVARTAREFEQQAENVKVDVVSHSERLGLRNHILWCGDLSQEHGSVVVLEDDLFVDPYFYRYAAATLSFYEDDPHASGIALYAPQHNEFAFLPFQPMRSGFSTYPMQTACSWGQCWSASQWARFRQWYDKASQTDVDRRIDLPARVKGWPESSWKKYFAAFLVDSNTSFLYPYEGFSTNCSDPGGFHNSAGTSVHQINFGWHSRTAPVWNFCLSAESPVSYDSFMEQSGAPVLESLGIDPVETEIDLYALKPLELVKRKSLVVTSRPLPNAQTGFPYSFRPLEQNLRFPDQPARDRLVLAPTENLRRLPARKLKLALLSYYAGYNLESRKSLESLVRDVPRAWLSRAWKAITSRT